MLEMMKLSSFGSNWLGMLCDENGSERLRGREGGMEKKKRMNEREW